jgi:hypothetical protein
MIPNHFPSRQPARVPWDRDKLLRERTIFLGQAIDKSTLKSYSSALNSYLTFVRNHNFPVEPTADTLSFYATYMAHHINPRSVVSYLSGISQQLEPYFPGVREARKSPLVERTLKGCQRLKGVATKRKRALAISDLLHVVNDLKSSTQHDDLLFLAILLTGFFALMRLGELVFPDDKQLQNWRKISKRSSAIISDDQYEFHLPSHKADRFFEGNRIIIKKAQFCNLNPLNIFRDYLTSRDSTFPLASPLWLTSTGTVPTRHFFMSRLHQYFSRDIGGHSMRAGGATSLAENGVPPSLIQFMGRWSSDAFFIYIRKNPTLIQALLYSEHKQ